MEDRLRHAGGPVHISIPLHKWPIEATCFDFQTCISRHLHEGNLYKISLSTEKKYFFRQKTGITTNTKTASLVEPFFRFDLRLFRTNALEMNAM